MLVKCLFEGNVRWRLLFVMVSATEDMRLPGKGPHGPTRDRRIILNDLFRGTYYIETHRFCWLVYLASFLLLVSPFCYQPILKATKEKSPYVYIYIYMFLFIYIYICIYIYIYIYVCCMMVA